MEVIRKNQKGMLEIKTQMKNAFDELMSKLDVAKERISELKNISLKTSKTEKKVSKNCGMTTEVLTCV